MGGNKGKQTLADFVYETGLHMTFENRLYQKQSCLSKQDSVMNFSHKTFIKATITRCDLSATILFKLVESHLIAFKFAQ